MKKIFVFTLLIFQMAGIAQSRKLTQGTWRAALHRQDSNLVQFNMDFAYVKGQWQIAIRNASEKIFVKDIIVKNDSVNFSMPVFESAFKTAIQPDGSLKGTWFKGTAQQTQQWLFTAVPNKKERFILEQGSAKSNISGKWMLSLNRPNEARRRPAVADLKQKGNILTGTVLTPSGDYRYLEGIVTGDSFKLSVFDGAHAYSFVGKIAASDKMSGLFYSGYAGVEEWTAFKDNNAKLPDVGNVPVIKNGQDRLDFSFRDLDGKMVSIADERFRNKVVVVQLMGSWCPNCLDETKFLSNYYSKNRSRGVEMVALAYEYSTDYERSKRSLDKFRNLYNVQYPMLITGVWVNDSLRTEKTLPQITPIKAFPTTIYLGKDGKIKQIEAGFTGPGSGEYYKVFQKEFEARIEELLKEK